MIRTSRLLLLAVLISISCLTSIGNQTKLTAQGEFTPEFYYVYTPILQKPFSPLYDGLYARWDGTGYLHLDKNYVVGTHLTRLLFSTEGDIGQIYNYNWYDPDPLEFGESVWFSYYSLSTGRFLSSSGTQNPYWKWGHDWILPYDVQFQHGQAIYISGQKFSVTGPHPGLTTFGKPVDYWELINQDKFLFWDDGGEWKQYVEPGDAKLRYDSGRTRLIVHYDIKRTDYNNGEKTEFTVHYIVNLSGSTTWPGSAKSEVLAQLVIQNAYEKRASSKFRLEESGFRR